MARRWKDTIYPGAQGWRVDRGALQYLCAWCDHVVASVVGIEFAAHENRSAHGGGVRQCPNCGYPSYIDPSGFVTPAAAYGERAADLPQQLADLYEEARDCVGVGAFHAAVMVCRKILMHVAVLQGAHEGKSFLAYVDYLVDNHHIPPTAKAWVDEIRKVGNDANHEISAITEVDAKATVDFVAMLLKLIYEFPAKGAASVASRAEESKPPG